VQRAAAAAARGRGLTAQRELRMPRRGAGQRRGVSALRAASLLCAVAAGALEDGITRPWSAVVTLDEREVRRAGAVPVGEMATAHAARGAGRAAGRHPALLPRRGAAVRPPGA